MVQTEVAHEGHNVDIRAMLVVSTYYLVFFGVEDIPRQFLGIVGVVHCSDRVSGRI